MPHIPPQTVIPLMQKSFYSETKYCQHAGGASFQIANGRFRQKEGMFSLFCASELAGI
jgi:hypothetical protein